MKTLYCALAAACLLTAQTPTPDGVVSPDVHPDRTVTFRIRAPKAAEVALYGGWMPVTESKPMTKDANGIWSVTVGPFEPSGQLYWFILDGIAIADPVNPVVKLRQRTSASLVEIPGSPAAPWEVRDVPHGTVVTEWAKSALLGRTERIVLYLPPGYEKSKQRYPVLYLVHGSGDTPDSWTNAARANLILDSLIADGKAKPMIIVMPAGHATPFGVRPAEGAPSNNELFEQYLTKELIPLVEGKYRVAAGQKNRALAGLSMGGGHTIYTGFTHPELFSALGPFSPAIPRKFESNLDPKMPKLWIACGDKDLTTRYDRVKAWAEAVEKAGLKSSFHTYPGGHTWPVWRQSLTDFAQTLFK